LSPFVVWNITSAGAQNIALQLESYSHRREDQLGCLASTLCTGTFQLKSGTLQLDTASGKVSGAIACGCEEAANWVTARATEDA